MLLSGYEGVCYASYRIIAVNSGIKCHCIRGNRWSHCHDTNVTSTAWCTYRQPHKQTLALTRQTLRKTQVLPQQMPNRGDYWRVHRKVWEETSELLSAVLPMCVPHATRTPHSFQGSVHGNIKELSSFPRVKAFTSVGIPSCSTNSRLSICTLGKAILSISYKTFSHKYRDKCNSIQYMVQFSKNAKIDRLASQWDVRRINIDSGVFDIINLGVVTYVFHSIMCHFLAPEKYLPWQVHPSSTTSPLLCCIHFSMLAIHSSNIVNNQF